MSNPIQNDDYTPLAEAKIAIITTLSKFHQDLGQRAADILYNDDRMNIVEMPEHPKGVMQCRPAGLTKEHLIKNDMYMPDFAQRFGPDFTEQENPTDQAIIDYEYDGSPSSIVYLAHELGHAIADDIQKENGKSFKDFTNTQAEQQAYFVQSIYSHYTGQASAESTQAQIVQQDDLNKGELKVSWERVNQYNYANDQIQNGISMGMDERRELMVKALGETAETEQNVQPLETRTHKVSGLENV